MNKKIDLAIKDAAKHNGLSVVYAELKYRPDSKPDMMHWHNFFEMEMILSGSGTSVCNHKTYELKRGMLSYLTPTDIHQYIFTSDTNILRIHFTLESIDPEILEGFFNLKDNVIYLTEDQIERTVSICNLIKNNNIPGKTGKMYSSQLLQTLFFSLKDEFKPISNTYKDSPLPIQKALIYIHSHFKENPQLEDIARSLYLTKNYLCALFKKNMGESYTSYLKKLKLNYAADLLRHSDLSITQIALDSGYATQAHFNRDFKSFFGMSPRDIRKESETK